MKHRGALGLLVTKILNFPLLAFAAVIPSSLAFLLLPLEHFSPND